MGSTTGDAGSCTDVIPLVGRAVCSADAQACIDVTCSSAADPNTCVDNCLLAEPACDDCTSQNFISCTNAQGCMDEWVAFICCADAHSCSDRTCATTYCPAEDTALTHCQTPIATAGTCTTQVRSCFPNP